MSENKETFHTVFSGDVEITRLLPLITTFTLGLFPRRPVAMKTYFDYVGYSGAIHDITTYTDYIDTRRLRLSKINTERRRNGWRHFEK